MSDSERGFTSEGAPAEGLVLELFALAGVDHDARWQRIAKDPEAVHKLAAGIAAVAALPIVQADAGGAVPLVYKNHVINIRPFVIPVLVAAVVHVAITIAPSLESALIPWLDIVDFLEKAGEVYRHLDDDEVDVFGAVAALWTISKRAPSVTDPSLHPTADGIGRWFLNKGYEAPPNVDAILESLRKKGAVSVEDGLYRPSFLGARRD
jgi:hypothetical protein